MIIIKLQDYEIDLKLIKPKNVKKSDKYSKVIYKFLKNNPRMRRVWFDEAIYDSNSNNYIRKPFDVDNMNLRNLFFGMPETENSICITGKCIGSLIQEVKKSQEIYFYMGYQSSHYVEVTKEFFDKYIEIGRCIYGHYNWLPNDENRYTYINDTHRKCNWCGKEQCEKTIIHKYEIKTWEDC